MLLELKINNFLSFGELTTFSMIASNDKNTTQNKNVTKFNNVSVLRQAVIFGANASGKTNLVSAFEFIKNYITNPIMYKEDTIMMYTESNMKNITNSMFSKLQTGNDSKPSSFELTFIIDSKLYYYAFEILMKNQDIISESLYELSADDSSQTMVFEREQNSRPVINKDLFLDKDLLRLEMYLEDFDEHSGILFLTFMNLNKKYSSDSKLYFFKNIFEWFSSNVLINDLPNTLASNRFYEDSLLDDIINIISSFDTGITEVVREDVNYKEFKRMIPSQLFNEIEKHLYINKNNKKNSDGNTTGVFSVRLNYDFFSIKIDLNNEWHISTIKLKHGKSPYRFEFKEESSGTVRLFSLIEILLANEENKVYIIDELERSLHPNITLKFIEFFKKYHKDSKTQLIFTTHESCLLNTNILSRDEIWFVERDIMNNSDLFPLDKFTDKYDHVLDKAYLQGRYGAIPVLNSIL